MRRIRFLCGAIALALSGPAVAGVTQDDGVAESGDTRRRDSAEAIRERIRTDPLAPAVAPRGYDVTIVVFSDYQCGYCRRFGPMLDTLIASDPKLRVVWRDWPILGGGSLPAARAAVAASFQGRHGRFHRALLAQSGRIDAAKIRAAATAAGVDWPRLQRDLAARGGEIDALLARNNAHARTLGLTGTPGLMVGPYLIPGLVDLPTLRGAIARARRGG